MYCDFMDSFKHTSDNLLTKETLTTINFDEQLISKLISNLNPNKAHGHDGLSIRMFHMSPSQTSINNL